MKNIYFKSRFYIAKKEMTNVAMELPLWSTYN